MKILASFIIFSFSLSLFAAGDAHSAGHVSDLLYPAINFALLIGFFVWKIRPMVARAFTNYHYQVSESFNIAEIKEAQAQLELESVQKKINSSDAEIQNIQKNVDKEAQSFDARYSEEIKERISRSKNDLERRVNADKEEAVAAITKELVNKVVLDAKQLVNSNNDKKNKIVDSFMSRLQ